MINLYLNERSIADVTILDLKGKLRVGGNALALHKTIRCLMSEKKKKILLNLTGVTFIDSCGFGELVGSQISVENNGGEMKLVGLTDDLSELLTVTRLITVFDVYETEAEALQNFAVAAVELEKPQLAFA